MESRNTRLGYALFLVYLVAYTGFVVLAAFAPSVMSKVFGGLNLAVIYGFALIIFAIVLSAIYGFLCKSEGSDSNGGAA